MCRNLRRVSPGWPGCVGLCGGALDNYIKSGGGYVDDYLETHYVLTNLKFAYISIDMSVVKLLHTIILNILM